MLVSSGLTVYLPTRLHNFIEISRHLPMVWQKMHRLGFFGTRWILLVFRSFRFHKGSVATHVRCGGMSTQRCIAKFLLRLSVKDF